MESPQEFSASSYHHHILRRKRTKRHRSPSPIPTQEDEDMANCLISLSHGNYSHNITTPRKFMYECKICERSFHTFQALGGHRASHKKSKSVVMEVVTPKVKDGELHEEGKYGNMKKSRVHECSICGSEFSSGQALGGHMRRHRAITPSGVTESNSELTREDEGERSVLLFDLNLPAPQEDDYPSESVFRVIPNNQNLVFASSTLVGCQY